MEADAVSPPKPVCYTGCLGDRGVGKTTLLSAITKLLAESTRGGFRAVVDLDRNKDAIECGDAPLGMFVEYESPDRAYLHTDIPGPGAVRFASEDWAQIEGDHLCRVRLRGARDMHGAVLVVSARQGVPDRDSLLLARQATVRSLIVFINGMDELESRADHYLIESELEPRIRLLLSRDGYSAQTPIIRGSALAALEERDRDIGEEAIERLLAAMDRYLPIATVGTADMGFPPP